MNAVQSVLAEGAPGRRVLVSDNSSDPAERAMLAKYCAQLPTGLVEYVATPTDMPMTVHWQWAMEQALQRGQESHLTYLTDRMVVKMGEQAALLSIAEDHPDRIITYNHDKVIDFGRPIRVEAAPWSGGVFEIDAAHLLRCSARGVLHACLPRMLNCIVPRTVLLDLRQQWGEIFSSTSPDFFFAYRALDMVGTILFYDKGCLTQYALDRSNGASYARGVASADSEDFQSKMDTTQNWASPIPKLQTVPNAIFHEYCVVRHTSTSGNMPELDLSGYLAANRRAIADIQNGALGQEMIETLREASGQLSSLHATLMRWTDYRLPDRVRKLWIGARHPLPTAALLVNRAAEQVSARLNGSLREPSRRPIGSLQFESVEDAIAYLDGMPAKRSRHPTSLLPLLVPTGRVRRIA